MVPEMFSSFIWYIPPVASNGLLSNCFPVLLNSTGRLGNLRGIPLLDRLVPELFYSTPVASMVP